MVNSKIVTKAAETGGELIETDFIAVVFQNGFPSQVGINGCRVEDVIELAVRRLDQFQAGPLACEENERALRHLHGALEALQERLRRRQEQGVLNTMGRHESQRTEDHVEDFSATGA
jgi:hypothetical protein